MSGEVHERTARRIADLYAKDQQFAAAKPNETVSAAIEQPGLPLIEIMRTVTEGYSNRPALGERAVEFVADPASGRTSVQLLPRFVTITYGELWVRVGALTTALSMVRLGDQICILGFTSVDHTVIDMATIPLGLVSVPLQTGARRSRSYCLLSPKPKPNPSPSPPASTISMTPSNWCARPVRQSPQETNKQPRQSGRR